MGTGSAQGLLADGHLQKRLEVRRTNDRRALIKSRNLSPPESRSH